VGGAVGGQETNINTGPFQHNEKPLFPQMNHLRGNSRLIMMFYVQATQEIGLQFGS
jgi:hypothetical protein